MRRRQSGSAARRSPPQRRRRRSSADATSVERCAAFPQRTPRRNDRVASGAAVAVDSSVDSPSDDRAEFVDLLPVPPCRRGETDITSQFTQQAGGGDNPTVTLTPDQGNPSVSGIYIQGPRMQFKNTSMPRNRSRAS